MPCRLVFLLRHTCILPQAAAENPKYTGLYTLNMLPLDRGADGYFEVAVLLDEREKKPTQSMHGQ